MSWLCRFGLHDWSVKKTARAGVSVHRCRRCHHFVRTVNDRERRRKRHYFATAILVSAAAWYVLVALGLTGHTKVLWGIEKVFDNLGHVAGRVDRRVDHASPYISRNRA